MSHSEVTKNGMTCGTWTSRTPEMAFLVNQENADVSIFIKMLILITMLVLSCVVVQFKQIIPFFATPEREKFDQMNIFREH